MVPSLLLKEEGKPRRMTTLARLPLAFAEHVLKHLHKLLSSFNSHSGKQFLEGNFAPTHSEVFEENLPLITQTMSTNTTHETALHPAIRMTGGKAAVNVASNAKFTAGTSPTSILSACISSSSSISSSCSSSSISSSSSSNSAAYEVHSSNWDAGVDDVLHLPDQQAGKTSVNCIGDQQALAANIIGNEPKLYGAASLPAGLSGAFMRVGSNPYLAPIGGYHWFDGDGMVHAVRIKDGKASYCNRWVPTSRLKQEVSAGWPLFYKMGDIVGIRGLMIVMLNKLKSTMGFMDDSAGVGAANTALVCHASQLLALNESDMPYALKLMCSGLLEAVGQLTVSGPAGKSFTAHPKVDPVTGELHFFGYTFEAAPYVSYGVLGPTGELVKTVHITQKNVSQPVMMHDFAITQSYVVFLDNPLCFDLKHMLKHNSLPISFKADQGSRIGLLRRDAVDDSEMVWIKVPAHIAFHVANAWEEPDGKIKIFAPHLKSFDLNLDAKSTDSVPADEQPRMAVITVDPNNPDKEGTIKFMTQTVGDFPCINPRFVGRKCRYAYMATMVTDCGAAFKWDGVAKIDLWAENADDAAVDKITLPDGCYSGETVFVPRHEDPTQCTSEDDGYLVTYVHDETAAAANGNCGSSLVIWDALTMNPQPLAVVKMPARVPYGFHAYWMSESQVQQQTTGEPLAHVSGPV